MNRGELIKLKQQLNGKRFSSDVNSPSEMHVNVINVVASGRGFSVMFNRDGCGWVFCALNRFNKRYPHEVVK